MEIDGETIRGTQTHIHTHSYRQKNETRHIIEAKQQLNKMKEERDRKKIRNDKKCQ